MPIVRPPAVAGTFYPGSRARLIADVDELLAGTPPPAGPAPKALIVPHAGYIYSGPIAARAYAHLKPIADRISRVVLLGPSHRVHVNGLALPEATVFETPLGPASIDAEAAAKLPGVVKSAAAHAREHSLEVQIPFLQRILPRFDLVPLAVGDARPGTVAAVIDALWGGPETIILISSDLSHYLPYAEGRAIDRETVKRVVDLSASPIDHDRACGATPINGLVAAARSRKLRPSLLDLRSSGDTAGDRDHVVGYAAIAFHEEAA